MSKRENLVAVAALALFATAVAVISGAVAAIFDADTTRLLLDAPLRQVAGQQGWLATLNSLPYALAFKSLGQTGVLVVAALMCGLTLSLVFLVVRHFANSNLALLAAFAYASSPLLTKTAGMLLPVSSSLFSLAAVLAAVFASRAKAGWQRTALWVGCIGLCAANLFLFDWALWLPVFILLIFWEPKLNGGQSKILYASLGLAWLALLGDQIYRQGLAFYDPLTPLRSILLVPEASYGGYSAMRSQYPYLLPGNDPAMVLALCGLLAVPKKPGLLRFPALWLLSAVAFNFWHLQVGNSEVLLLLLLPLSVLIAYFFQGIELKLSWFLFGLASLCGIAVFLSAEPAAPYAVIDFNLVGWQTDSAWRDLTQTAGGFLPTVAILVFAFSSRWKAKWRVAGLGLVLALFALSRVGLMLFF